MSYVTVLWSMTAATALLLGTVHLFVCALNRRAGANLAFAAVAFAVVGISQLTTWGIVRLPVMIALPFLVTLVAMALELSRDIVRAPRLARELGESKQRFDLVARAAAELRRDLAHAGRVTMLGQLASALAHELSQPLAAILRNAEAAEMILHTSSPDLEELRAIMADIRRDDRRAGDVIDRLRTLLERRRLDFQAVSIDGLVQEVSALVRPEAIAKHVTLECTVASGLPRVSGDRVHLSQVLINLMLNGMDSVVQSKRTRRVVAVAARASAECSIEVAVSDSGTGIAKDVLARLFEPFFTTKSHGMGMGLAVSRTIVEAHGGQLWAENNPAGGATFRFTVPAMDGGR